MNRGFKKHASKIKDGAIHDDDFSNSASGGAILQHVLNFWTPMSWAPGPYSRVARPSGYGRVGVR